MYRGGYLIGPGNFAGRGDGGPHVLGILFFAVFLVAVIAVVVLAVRWVRGASASPAYAAAQPSPPDAALATARLRYAGGELSREDFLRISADLHVPGAPGA